MPLSARRLSLPTVLYAGALTVFGIVFNALCLGWPTIGLDFGLILAFVFFLSGKWEVQRSRVLGTYLVSIAVLLIHLAEESRTGFAEEFPRLFGLEWSQERFLLFNIVWLAVFLIGAIGLFFELLWGSFVLIFFALAAGLLNGAGHLALTLFGGRYFPGAWSAPFLLLCGIVLLGRLRRDEPSQPVVQTAPQRKLLLVVQGTIFTILVPGTVTWWLPQTLLDVDWTIRYPAGWIMTTCGAGLYFWCAGQFLFRGEGTPNISFARTLEFLIGREPRFLVDKSIYRYSRNPMYVGVITTVFGEALLFGSFPLLAYALGLCLWFHLVVLLIEEPHLRRTRGAAYEEYCRTTPRWLLKF